MHVIAESQWGPLGASRLSNHAPQACRRRRRLAGRQCRTAHAPRAPDLAVRERGVGGIQAREPSQEHRDLRVSGMHPASAGGQARCSRSACDRCPCAAAAGPRRARCAAACNKQPVGGPTSHCVLQGCQSTMIVASRATVRCCPLGPGPWQAACRRRRLVVQAQAAAQDLQEARRPPQKARGAGGSARAAVRAAGGRPRSAPAGSPLHHPHCRPTQP